MQWSDLASRPRPEPSARLAYGKSDLQFAELWLPPGQGPFPVVMAIHGGCWRTGVADRTVMNWMADDLARRGIAVWNVEYRGVDRPGGGYPGTYQDIAAAGDALRRLAPLFRLKADRIVVVGHSAGGHLGLWLAARPAIAGNGPLRAQRPVAINSVFSLGGVPDLEAEIADRSRPCDLSAGAKAMAGPMTQLRPDRFRDTSPPAMVQGGAKQILVNAAEDKIAPPAMAAAYARKLAAKGVKPMLITVPDEGHVELIAPGSAAWNITAELIAAELDMTPAKPRAD
nr:alpha/beta hydrolase [Sphingomonas laterariae]